MMMNPALFAAIAGSLVATKVAAQAGFSALPYSFITSANHSCVLDTPGLSCPEANPMEVDSCCQETFGGLVLHTQFWTISTGLESEGQLLPQGAWGIHGVWPDLCNGSYTGYCDVSRQFDPEPSPNVSSTGIPLEDYTGNVTGAAVLTQFERFDLLDYMNTYWISRGQPNDVLWMHEYSKHATCFSNFQTECWGPEYTEHEEIVAFFDMAVAADRRYPTYDFLAKAGITPSNTTKYSLSDMQAALTNATGALPYLGCAGPRYNETAAGNGTSDRGRTELSEVWYYNHAYGRVDALNWTAVETTSNSSCANTSNAISYYERAPGSESSA